ncbi:hypothetical protein F511_32827 [Dorcoceras hygrometricum]|uniref:Uncharacterized protein n=1 Tax=Dorcoceras hygrometricum TaxID=472368 RepID=A0A2Z7D1A6_9LAMI|nr:hypothetical protein F511_32827 [Dorcoceras hygrometricum]
MTSPERSRSGGRRRRRHHQRKLAAAARATSRERRASSTSSARPGGESHAQQIAQRRSKRPATMRLAAQQQLPPICAASARRGGVPRDVNARHVRQGVQVPADQQHSDCGRLSPIRSMTRTETPSSGYTRSADEISTNGFSSSSWPETNFRRQRAAAAALGEERRGGFCARV